MGRGACIDLTTTRCKKPKADTGTMNVLPVTIQGREIKITPANFLSGYLVINRANEVGDATPTNHQRSTPPSCDSLRTNPFI